MTADSKQPLLSILLNTWYGHQTGYNQLCLTPESRTEICLRFN